jgi:hypothetical protein
MRAPTSLDSGAPRRSDALCARAQPSGGLERLAPAVRAQQGADRRSAYFCCMPATIPDRKQACVGQLQAAADASSLGGSETPSGSSASSPAGIADIATGSTAVGTETDAGARPTGETSGAPTGCSAPEGEKTKAQKSPLLARMLRLRRPTLHHSQTKEPPSLKRHLVGMPERRTAHPHL